MGLLTHAQLSFFVEEKRAEERGGVAGAERHRSQELGSPSHISKVDLQTVGVWGEGGGPCGGKERLGVWGAGMSEP